MPELARLGNRVEDPLHAPGAHVVAADVPRRRLLVAGALGHRGSHDDDVADDHRRRANRVETRIDCASEALFEIDAAVAPEVRVRPRRSWRRSTGDRPGRRRTTAAPSRRRSSKPSPAGQKAVHGRAPFQVQPRVVAPQCLAAGRIDGGNLSEVRRHVEHAVDHERRDLVGVGAERAVLPHDLVAGPERFVDRRPRPGDAQVSNVVAGDLVESGILRVPLVPAVAAPLAGSGTGLRLNRARDQERGEARQTDQSSRALVRHLHSPWRLPCRQPFRTRRAAGKRGEYTRAATISPPDNSLPSTRRSR